ncbi:shikimate kinase [Nitrospira sp.]|nr:shikimate kinase [Nitrospira sp.]
MNIVLIGYRGTGKSSVAKILAHRLGRRLVSTDAEVVTQAGRSIPDIVQSHGWEHFREQESVICRQVGAEDGLIIDTGGGAILRDENVRALKGNGVVFWLTAAVPTIAARIAGDTNRPSLTGGKSFVDEVAEVLQDRAPKYRAAADHTLATDDELPTQIAARILALLETRPVH